MPLPNDPQPWPVLATQIAFHNRWIKVVLDEVQLPNGQHHQYTRLEGPAVGVAVIGFNDAGEVLLEREYRHGVGQVIWQLPGGLAHGDEELQAAGLRELAEETGYAPRQVTAESVRYLGMIWHAPVYGPLRCHLYAAWGLQPTGILQRDPTEFVTLHWVSLAWLKDAVRDGTIQEPSTGQGLLV
jgi:ADP-ribose pyrophosphatase